MHRIFVYGTLKSGCANHNGMLQAEVCLGDYSTVEKYPLVLTGPWYSPVMFPEPGVGHCVHGEVYEVNDEKLAELDEFEYLHLPKGFRRFELEVVSNKRELLIVEVYMRPRKYIKEVRSEYLEKYQDHRYVHEDDR